MLHKIFFAAVASATMLAMTGCGLFQSAYPENFPAEWKEKETFHARQDVAPGVTAYSYRFDDFKAGAPLSINLVVADWKKMEGQLRLRMVSNGGKPEQVTAPVAKMQPLAVASGTESDAAGKPLTAVKTFTLSGGSVVLEPANPKNRVKGHALVSAKGYFPMIIKSVPGILTDPGYENAVQGMLLAENGKSIFSRPIGGQGAYTVIGLNQEKQLLILLVVDGYHQKVSPGCSLSDLPEIMFALGAKDVLCINAGPCGALAIADEDAPGTLKVISHPADGGVFDHNGARPASNRIVLGTESTEKSTVKK